MNGSLAVRLQIHVRGQVQGVGFRPCVYRLAKQLGLTGWVKNNGSGVLIEVQGVLCFDFLSQLEHNLPSMARVASIQQMAIPLQAQDSLFTIVSSEKGQVNTLISPDHSLCADCLTELFDPQSRYFRYPFLNCTHCGPRFSIARTLPYDRAQTALAQFPLCSACEIDYCNPDNRRYHAQSMACVQCGPQLSLPIEAIAQAIADGEIIALKGLGGYQLICDAYNEEAVRRLRERKHRQTKPFAIMVATLQSAHALVEIDDCAERELQSPARPIVLLKKKDAGVPDGIAPGLNHLGIMLPDTPLHYLLFNALAGGADGCQWLAAFQSTCLVVTSANCGGEPLVVDDETALRDLSLIADRIISHDRPIITREDDSVLRLIQGAPVFIRRSRGFVPTPIQLPYAIPPTLATGGHLKNTFCITRGDEAFVSQHIGSLNNKATIDFYHESLTHWLVFLDIKPEQVAHDLHPDFYTTQWAQDCGIPAFGVQHHQAHMASVVAEHGLQQPVLGLVLDGYGYGLQGEALGGELLLLEGASFSCLGSFSPLPQPGGELVVREPWRMGASVLHALGRGHEISPRFPNLPHARAIHHLLDKKINAPMTSSCGRLFDAASALLGIQTHSQYEGEAAMRLESLVTLPQIASNGWRITDLCFDLLPVFELLINTDCPVAGANLFHGTLIAGLAAWLCVRCRERQIDVVVLGGGCFLNQILAQGLIQALSELGIRALLPRHLPPNDGGLSLGQAWFAGLQKG